MSQSKKETDLKSLYHLCREPKIVGLFNNMYYGELIRRYPCRFLIYSENIKGEEENKELSKKRIKEEIESRIDKILSIPLDSNDGDLFDQLIQKLDDIINDRINKG